MQSRSLTPIESVYLVRDPEEAATLLQRDRLRLVCALNAPASGAELARRLGLPRQRVTYHLRELETAGLVQLVEARHGAA